MLRDLGALGGGAAVAPANVTLASMGQRYRDYPAATFDQRFGPYDVGRYNSQDLMRRLIEEGQLRLDPSVLIPGSQTIDPLGHRGVRDPETGYYFLRGI